MEDNKKITARCVGVGCGKPVAHLGELCAECSAKLDKWKREIEDVREQRTKPTEQPMRST